MEIKSKIMALVVKKGRVYTADLVKKFSVSRQYLNQLITELIEAGELVKIGRTRSVFYVLPDKLDELKGIVYKKTFTNTSLEEDVILKDVKEKMPHLRKLPKNVEGIFDYVFLEMLNNAIEHSGAKRIKIEVAIRNRNLTFSIDDGGVGVFRNILEKRKLQSELEAIQDLMKGKATTMPQSHSGEGIFFSSKTADHFTLDSFGYQLIVDNNIPDVFVEKSNYPKRGTSVSFKINTRSKREINDVFKQYTDVTEDGDFGFDKTKIQVKLYTLEGSYISRSQARRILVGLDQFKVIEFDFYKVSTVGQAFADEIFRVFQNKYPKIILQTTNMNEVVEFMVKRAKNNPLS